jgi:uncharacterized membrane protein
MESPLETNDLDLKSLSDVPVEDFETALSDEHLRTMQVIGVALPIGVVIFAAIVGVMYFVREPAIPQDAGAVNALTAVHALFAIVGLVGAWLLPEIMFREANLRKWAVWAGRTVVAREGANRQATLCIGLIQMSRIIRLAVLEGVAFLGLVACLLAVQQGTVQHQPLYWLNASTALLFIAYAALTIPTRDRITREFTSKIQKDPFAAY